MSTQVLVRAMSTQVSVRKEVFIFLGLVIASYAVSLLLYLF